MQAENLTQSAHVRDVARRTLHQTAPANDDCCTRCPARSCSIHRRQVGVYRPYLVLPDRCDSGSWAGRRPRLVPYVTVTGAADAATASGGRPCCLPAALLAVLQQVPRARFCRTAGRRQTLTASPLLNGALRSPGLVFRAGGRDVDEDVRNDWQRRSDPAIEIIHRAGEPLDIQLGRGMNLGRDDDLFGSRIASSGPV